MDKLDFFKKIMSIHDQAIGQMRTLQIAPYPSNYKFYFDQIFLQIADEELKKAQSDAGYKVQASAKNDITKYVELAQRSVSSYAQTHSNLSVVAKNQNELISQAPDSLFEEYVTFIEGLQNINKSLSNELSDAQSKIEEMSTELKEALALMTIDPVTKISNRDAFLERLDLIMDVGKDKKLSMILLLVDIDNFRYVNDEHTQKAGDNALLYVAQTIKSMIREGDKIFRYEGDRFAILFARCDIKEAQNIADKIRTKIERTKLLYMDKAIYLSISGGITYHRSGDTTASIISRAEEALICAKKSGKNCNVLHDW